VAIAAVTPRVRTIVICDDVSASVTEPDVFTLEGVRLQLLASAFPHSTDLCVYLLLSSARKGTYSGKIRIVNERTGKAIRYAKLLAQFDDDAELAPLSVEIGRCVFPEAGEYSLEVHFSTRDGDALKGEHPFRVVADER
jgi:hypothetical protein